MNEMECSCQLECEGEPILNMQRCMAKSTHPKECYECLETIQPGRWYEKVTGIFDGEDMLAYTCEACLRIAKDFCCGGRVYGALGYDLYYSDMKVILSEKFRPYVESHA